METRGRSVESSWPTIPWPQTPHAPDSWGSTRRRLFTFGPQHNFSGILRSCKSTNLQNRFALLPLRLRRSLSRHICRRQSPPPTREADYRSFIMERDYWIDAHPPSRGNVANAMGVSSTETPTNVNGSWSLMP